jgi:hypothetical protein
MGVPNVQLRSVEFGKFRSGQTGSSGVTYAVLDVLGNAVIGPTTTGIYELTSGSGCYAADISFPDSFHGSVLWECPPVTASCGGNSFILTSSFATEQYNVEENDPKVADTWTMVNHITGSIEALYDQAFGRWQIINNQMLFYAPDNVTLLATFNLYDDTNTPNQVNVFQRTLVPPVNPNPP